MQFVAQVGLPNKKDKKWVTMKSDKPKLTAEQIEHQCGRKHRWGSREAAMAGAIHSLQRFPTTGRLYTYKCEICRGWHLTKVKQQNQEPITLESFNCKPNS